MIDKSNAKIERFNNNCAKIQECIIVKTMTKRTSDLIKEFDDKMEKVKGKIERSKVSKFNKVK